MIKALKGISFEVGRGEIVSLIGANGAGKTTTLHTITGLISPKHGSIFYKNRDITKLPAHKIVEAGLVHVPEGRRVHQTGIEITSKWEHLTFRRCRKNSYLNFPHLTRMELYESAV